MMNPGNNISTDDSILDPFEYYGPQVFKNIIIRYSHYTSPTKWKESKVIKTKETPCAVPTGCVTQIFLQNGDVIQFDLHNIKIVGDI